MSMSSAPAPRALIPYAALIGAIVSLCAGTSFAKQLFPLVGAQGATAYRVGFSALLLCLIWRPWRQPLSREDLGRLALYGSVLGLMNDRENHVQLLMDEDVLKGEYIGCHPCINTSSLRLRTADLMEKILPAVHHEPRIVTLPQE